MIKAIDFNDACMHLGPDEVEKKGGITLSVRTLVPAQDAAGAFLGFW